MSTNSFLQKKGFGFGQQDNANFPEHQELIGAGQYSHDLIDNYMERLVATATRNVVIDPVAVLDLTNQSDIAYTDLDLSSYTTPRTFAVILKLYFVDSGSAANITTFRVRKNGHVDAIDPILNASGGHINSMPGWAEGSVGCDENQTVEYEVNASGAGTATTVQIVLTGYYEGIWHYQQEE
ncbi:MAG: hypothetical protein ABIJ40_12315 [Bacteroidota bacterium]